MKALTALLLSTTVLLLHRPLRPTKRQVGRTTNRKAWSRSKPPCAWSTFGQPGAAPAVKKCPPCPHGTKRRKKAASIWSASHWIRPTTSASSLNKTPVSYPIWRYTGANSRNFMKAHGNNVGVLPFTVVEAPKCGYKQTITGEVNEKSLTAAVNLAKTKM